LNEVANRGIIFRRYPTAVSAGPFCELNDFRADGCLKETNPPKRVVSFLRVGVARLVKRLLGIFVTLCGSLTLLARFLTTAVLLTRPLTRRLIWLTELILVRHGVSFHGSAPTRLAVRVRS
jgi:hypothetical protein